MEVNIKGREIVLNTLNGRSTERASSTTHGWGLYKFTLNGFITGYDGEAAAWSLTGRDLADIEINYYNTFLPDTVQLGTGRSLTPTDEKREAEVRRLAKEVKKLESKAIIDEYIELASMSYEETKESGIYAHVKHVKEAIGNDTFIMLNEGNPFADTLDPHGLLGFEDGLVHLLTNPDMMSYLIFKLYDAKLERLLVLAENGADAYVGSETYCSADIISPASFRDVLLEPLKHFYGGLQKMGLYAVTYFLGNLFPMLPDIKKIPLDALMAEERNKATVIDIGQLYNEVDGAFTLFGNLCSVDILQKGSVSDVQKETERQLGLCQKGKFIMSNDCPISFGTPQENIEAMIKTAKGIK